MTKSSPQPLPSRASPTSGAAEGGLPAAVLKQLPRDSNFYSHLGPQGVRKGGNDSVRLADKRGEPGSSRAAGPPPSPSSGTWAVWAEKLSSCVPFRALAPTPEGTHGALVPVPPGLSCQAPITRRAWADNDFIQSL